MTRIHADAIKRYRTKRGLSLRALARLLGVEHSTLRAWESARIPQTLLAGLQLGADPAYWASVQIPTEQLSAQHAAALGRVVFWNEVVAGSRTVYGTDAARAREELAIAFFSEQAAKRALDARLREEGE